MYTAVVLNEKSVADILENFCDEMRSVGGGFQMQNAKGDPLLHHVTVNMGELDKELNTTDLLDKEITMNIVSFAKDLRVAAFGVEYKVVNGLSVFGDPEVKTKNAIPHITACINLQNGGKPFDSNDLKNWVPLYKVIEVKGVLSVVN